MVKFELYCLCSLRSSALASELVRKSAHISNTILYVRKSAHTSNTTLYVRKSARISVTTLDWEG